MAEKGFGAIAKKMHLDGASLFLIVSLLAVGLFYEFSAMLFCALLGVFLIVLFIKNKELAVYVNLTSVSVFTIALFYLLSSLWAVDGGAAFAGFFRFMPVPLFLILLWQRDKDGKEKVTAYLPFIGVIMTAVSAGLAQIPALSEYFTVAGRLSGFFAYPNTFAMFLLVCLILTLTGGKFGVKNALYAIVLLGGILYSGSRTVFVLTAVSLILLIFTVKNRKVKIAVGAGLGAVALAAVLIALLSDGYSVFGRFLTISLSSSTFIGRFLYFKDALPIILEHPFGTGYLGYYYLQQEFQTGLYSVRYVHNDILQLALDVGIIPALLFVASIIRSIFSKNTSGTLRIILLVFTAHALFDFDLQFIGMFMLFITLLDTHSGKTVILKKPVFFTVCTSVLSIMALWLTAAFALMSFGANEASARIYSANTQNDTVLLTEAETTAEMAEIAERILSRNAHVSVAYSAKAREAFSAGNFASVINHKKQVLRLAPFAYEEYEEYCTMLITGISLYEQAGDIQSADYCRAELVSCAEKLYSLPEKMSGEGKKIKDQPRIAFPQNITEYIEKTEVYLEG
ncbi:MAG: O-antigen ligase family protein [Ruminococcaceae bacterium]|nr:O-antigen ligase family protein [Oscillospiraceae bacterium]